MAFFIKTCLEWFNGVCMIEIQSPGVICDTIKINVLNISVPSVESTVIKWAQTQRGSANQYSCLHEFLGLFLEIFSFLTSDYLSDLRSQKLHSRIPNKTIFSTILNLEKFEML